MMDSNISRKCSYIDEGRSFQESWTNDFFLIENYGKPLCIICQETGSVMEEYNLDANTRANIPTLKALEITNRKIK